MSDMQPCLLEHRLAVGIVLLLAHNEIRAGPFNVTMLAEPCWSEVSDRGDGRYWLTLTQNCLTSENNWADCGLDDTCGETSRWQILIFPRMVLPTATR
eukprot:746168-Hanusia_phi.AAC.2